MRTCSAFALAALTLCSAFTPLAQAGTYSANTPMGIPDNNSTGASSTVQVADSGILSGLSVNIALTHSWIGDLVVSLTHAGNTVLLLDRPGAPASAIGDNSNLINSSTLTFIASAMVPAETLGAGCTNNETVGVSAGCANTVFLPHEAFTPFIGTSVTGDWVLNVRDVEQLDLGTLSGWTLNTVLAPSNLVPEPGSLALAGLGMVGLLTGRRRAHAGR